MKKENLFSQNIAAFFLLFAVIAISSCGKESLENSTFKESNTIENTSELDNANATIQAIYGFEEGELSKAEINELYAQIIAKASAEELNQLESFVAISMTQVEQSNLVAGARSSGDATVLSEGTPGDAYGSSIAKQGNTLFVGAPNSGVVHVYSGSSLVQTLSPSVEADNFGAVVSSSANKLAVASCGSVFIFKKQGNAWVEQTIITADVDFFAACATGTDLVLSGNTLAILGRTGTGSSIYVYKLNGNNWSLEDEMNLSESQIFLWDIDLAANTIVGNGGDGQLGPFLSPQVYVFEKSGNSWGLETQIAFPSDYLLSRAIAIDNSTIVANTAFGDLGATNSIVLTASGGDWTIDGEIVQPLPLPFGERFVDVKGSKVVLAVPSSFAGDDIAHVFEGSGGSWNLTETFLPNNGATHFFGTSPIISGNEILIGAPNSFLSPFVAGEVYIFD